MNAGNTDFWHWLGDTLGAVAAALISLVAGNWVVRRRSARRHESRQDERLGLHATEIKYTQKQTGVDPLNSERDDF